ncbi:MAG: hypothetical protein OEV34_01165 [Gammaproteobacteria bacterium]|jgi:hypothetical protein|nr:hypothetical protein [Gammaproteobacteria bacterium]
MTDRGPLPWPLWMLALDVVGSFILILGLLGLFGLVVPDSIDSQFIQAASISFVVIGTLLMLPFLVTVIRQVLGADKTG